MNNKLRRRQERGARVRDFAATQSKTFPDGKAAQTIARITTLVAESERLGAARETNIRNVRASTSGKSEARAALRTLLSAIGRTARAISLDDPDSKDQFRLPGNNPSNQLLLDTARSFLAAATPRKDQFIAYGMSSDFLADLAARIEAFEGHANQQHTGASARAADNAALVATLDALDAEVARFDTIIRNKFAADPATLAAWETAHHLERTLPKRKPAPPPPAPPK